MSEKMARTFSVNRLYHRYIHGTGLDLTVYEVAKFLERHGVIRLRADGMRYEQLKDMFREEFIKLYQGEKR